MLEVNMFDLAANATANLPYNYNNNNNATMTDDYYTNNYSNGSINDIATTITTTTTTATIATAMGDNTPLSDLATMNVSAAIVYDITAQWIGNAMDNVTNALTTYATETTLQYDYNASSTSTSQTLLDVEGANDLDALDDELWASPCDRYNPMFNCTPQQFLEYYQGPQRLPLYKALLATLVFGGIFLTGVVGNVLVCVVIIRHSIMHTATNYYLFSLAVSDLLYLLFGLPVEVFLYWHQYPYLFGLPFCKIRAYISEASTYVSVLTIVAFSMERFLAICHPLHLYAMSGFKRALRIIAALWVISFLSAIPFGLTTGILYENYPLDNSTIDDSAFCAVIYMPVHVPLFELSFCIFFIIPMILIIVLYWRMGARIRSRTMAQLGVQQSSMHKESRHQQSRKAVIRMLAAVVITFFICWLPFHMQRIWFIYVDDNNNEVNEWIFSITGFTYYVSCTINPILYNVMSHKYRLAFKDILCGRRKNSYYNNGFARDQSSFRETTVASSLGAGTNSGYDRVHSVRVRSIRQMNYVKDRDSIKSNNVLWTKKSSEFSTSPQDTVAEDSAATIVVVVDNGINGRPKVYTETDAQETLINKSNETCI